MLKRALAALLAGITLSAFAAVDANDAPLADLDSIKGIGPGTSAKIVEARQSAKFKDWSDFITRVPGIGEKRAAKLSAEGLTVNGAGFVPAGAEGAAKKPAAKAVAKAVVAPAPAAK